MIAEHHHPHTGLPGRRENLVTRAPGMIRIFRMNVHHGAIILLEHAEFDQGPPFAPKPHPILMRGLQPLRFKPFHGCQPQCRFGARVRCFRFLPLQSGLIPYGCRSRHEPCRNNYQHGQKPEFHCADHLHNTILRLQFVEWRNHHRRADSICRKHGCFVLGRNVVAAYPTTGVVFAALSVPA